jgi:hypothetical protein
MSCFCCCYCSSDAARKFLDELKARFPEVNVLDALEVVYPQYWRQGDCEQSFRKHLTILKDFYGEPR